MLVVIEMQQCVGFVDFKRIFAGQQSMRRVEAERTIDLELFLAEELITRRFVRKGPVPARIIANIVPLIAGQRRLDVEQPSACAVSVVDRTDSGMRTVWRFARGGIA